MTSPAVKNALAAKASALFRPASSKNNVLTPQIKDDASVDDSVSIRNVRWTGLHALLIGFARLRLHRRKEQAGWFGPFAPTSSHVIEVVPEAGSDGRSAQVH